MSLRDEITAAMDAQIEQSDATHRVARGVREGQQEFELIELVQMIGAITGAQRRAILTLAEEIDRLCSDE